MKDLVDTTEMYLRTIYELTEEGITPLRARIAERLEQSGPTVSQTVARMERDGLVQVSDDRTLKLTDEGMAIAVAVMRKHRLAECLLMDTLQMPREQVHEEACRWEHVMSDEVERRVFEHLNRPKFTPFGTPIPGLEQLGLKANSEPIRGKRLTDLPRNELVTATVIMFNEVLQSDAEVVNELRDAGIVPGAKVHAVVNDRGATLSYDEDKVSVPMDLAHAIVVENAD